MDILYEDVENDNNEMPGFLYQDSYRHRWVRLNMLWENFLPPENDLQKGGERVMSEHQLRVQRSLQKLTVPEWYKQAQIPREGFLLHKHQKQRPSWTGTTSAAGSKTTSLSSLTSSPLVLSPTPTTQPFVRWSTSKLNSTASSPCASTRSSFNASSSCRQPNGSISPSSLRSSFTYRQPYMGWRSQERLTRPRTPAERLASSILQQQQQHQLNHQANLNHQQESPEIQTSIKEVTSAIVHYVSGLRPEDLSDPYERQHRSPRGSQKLCWLESSFVGTKPLDSPQTPVTIGDSGSTAAATNKPPSSWRLDLQSSHNDMTLLLSNTTTGDGGSSSTASNEIFDSAVGGGSGSNLNIMNNSKPSPGSTTLEDVLDSLLGLPSSGRAPSPSLQATESANNSPTHRQQQCSCNNSSTPCRRCSDGGGATSDTSTASMPSRRSSLTNSPVLRCRYSRCGKTALALTDEANNYKNCHNCPYTYCSRACRRAHWEKHRKTCLFSRIGTLCRQVLAKAKEDKNTLFHLSSMARRGYLSHGAGAVKCFFSNPELAEKFVESGFQNLGELTYVRWQDLLPSEMGPQLYAELVKMCKNYNPDTKLVLYVSICVVSETPAQGAVKWERQLVSRCAKMRLSKRIDVPDRDHDNPDTLILYSPPINKNIVSSAEDVVRIRQTTVANLQKHLLQFGVLLRRQYPEIYKQLSVYCEGGTTEFTPVTVYPKDSVTGKSFMCILMLETSDENIRKVENVGVKIRTVDVYNYPFSD